MRLDLEQKVVLVTGSTRGIGAHLGQRFAAEGGRVVVTGRSTDAGERVADDIRRHGGDATFIRGDLADQEEVTSVVRTAVQTFGRIDVLVNNAAPIAELLDERPLAEGDADTFERIMRIGLYGAAAACRAVIPEMLRTGCGAIVNVSSINGVSGVPGLPAYAASKGALQALTRQLAADYGRAGVRSNCVVVGTIRHVGTAAWLDHPAMAAAVRNSLLTKGSDAGTPDDVADAVLFLASARAQFINGVLMPVDGGQTCLSALNVDLSEVAAELPSLDGSPDRSSAGSTR